VQFRIAALSPNLLHPFFSTLSIYKQKHNAVLGELYVEKETRNKVKMNLVQEMLEISSC
jgi:hypothetical protein